MPLDLDNAFLYIDHSAAFEDVRAMVARLCNAEVVGKRVVSSDQFSVELEASKTFDASRMHEHGGFVYYPYLAVIVPKEESDRDGFEKAVCELIIGLRNSSAKVVASSEFDDQIALQTGWNWSAATPDHPPIGEIVD